MEVSYKGNNIYVSIATCKIEDAIQNEKVRLENKKAVYMQDEQLTIECDFGYEMANDAIAIVRVCLSDRTWSGMDPNCTRSK